MAMEAAQASSADFFSTKRLTFRAVEDPDDLPLFLAINSDRIGYRNSNGSNIRLPTKADAQAFLTHVASGTFFSAIILADATSHLGAEAPELDPRLGSPPRVPIGQIHLKAARGTHTAHHRSTEIGIDILPAYQGRGFGTEAIDWVLDYAFRLAGLHRVAIGAFGWNLGAIKLYEKIGFRVEGREREALWHDGRWWDAVQLSLLEHEWAEMQQQRRQRVDTRE